MAYLAIAVIVSAVGIAALLWRQRAHTPRSIGDSIDRFARTRRALAPDADDDRVPGARDE